MTRQYWANTSFPLHEPTSFFRLLKKQIERDPVMPISRRHFIAGTIGTLTAAGTTGAANTTMPSLSFVLGNKIPSLPINKNMIGLSFEKNILRASLDVFSGTRSEYFADTLKYLGQGILRFGGATVEYTGWQIKATGDSSAVTTARVDELAAFVQKINWQVIYGVSFKSKSLAQIVDEVAYVKAKFGPHLHSIELGNEPNYSYKTIDLYLTRWHEIVGAIRAVFPNIVFLGPATSYATTAWLEPFAERTDRALYLSQHYYRGSGKDTASTAKKLLSDDSNFTGLLKLGTSLARAHGKLGFVLDEVNSFGGGGTPGVSDTFASSLWAAKTLATASSHGCVGVAFHGGGTAAYTPIEFVDPKGMTTIRPAYFGLLLYSEFRNDYHCAYQALSSPHDHLKIFVSCNEHSDDKRVMLINQSFDTDFNCIISNLSAMKYIMIDLKAPDIASKIDISFAGEIFSYQLDISKIAKPNSHSVSYETLAPISPNSDRSITLTVPKLSAVVLKPINS
jgi:hypothetical protein